jgi:hypothetical protein
VVTPNVIGTLAAQKKGVIQSMLDKKGKPRLLLASAIFSILTPALVALWLFSLGFPGPPFDSIPPLVCFLLAPAFGAYAFLAGLRELKRIRGTESTAGERKKLRIIALTGAIGSFIGLALLGLFVTLVLSHHGTVAQPRDNIIADLTNIAENASQYRIRPVSIGGGGGSYGGYSIPPGLSRNENGSYTIIGTPDSASINLRGGSSLNSDDWVEGTYGAAGRLVGPFKWGGPNFGQ